MSSVMPSVMCLFEIQITITRLKLLSNRTHARRHTHARTYPSLLVYHLYFRQNGYKMVQRHKGALLLSTKAEQESLAFNHEVDEAQRAILTMAFRKLMGSHSHLRLKHRTVFTSSAGSGVIHQPAMYSSRYLLKYHILDIHCHEYCSRRN